MLDPFIVFFTISMLLVYFAVTNSSAGAPSFSDDGRTTIISHGRTMKWLIVLTIFTFFLITVREGMMRSEDSGVFCLLIILNLSCGPYLVGEGFRARIEYNNDQFTATTAFRKPRTFDWSNLADIDFSGWTSTYVLRMNDGTKIRVSGYLSGIDALMDFARKWKKYNENEQ